MGRPILPAILAVVALATAATAVLTVPDPPAPAAGADPGPAPAAPVLSARRVPELTGTPGAERALAAVLGGLRQQSPSASCLVVERSDDGRALFAQGEELALAPASALKLVTGEVAVDTLGADERLRTAVVAAGEPEGGVVKGDLWLVGGGDPVLGTAAWAAHFEHQPALFTPLESLADEVVASGVQEVEGRVLGDDSRYDRVRYLPSWPERYRTGGSVGPLSALSVNDGFARWDGGAVAFPEPATGAAGVFADLLRERGVAVAGPEGEGRAPGEPAELAAVESPPVAELVASMVRESDNGTAELLTKELGRRAGGGEGSTAAGSDVLTRALDDRDLPLDGVRIVDGSGLDRGNTLTCGLLLALVAGAPEGGPVDEGLAVAGTSGTLTARYRGTPVAGRLRAKTGSLMGIASLAGEITSTAGVELRFAFVLNELDSERSGFDLQDALATTLVRHPDIADLVELGPAGYGG